MEIVLPKIGNPSLEMPYFPARWQAFLFRAYEYVPKEKIAEILGVQAEQVEKEADALGLPAYKAVDAWTTKGYITIIRRMWHILPYKQLLQLLDMDEKTFAILLREEDFLDIKLGDKPHCEPICWQPLTDEQQKKTAEVKKILAQYSVAGSEPFSFTFQLPPIEFGGEERVKTRILYAFSGLYQTAFDVESEVFCSDEMLEAYQKAGVNGIWTQAVLYQVSPFPFAPSLSEGYQERRARMRRFVARLAKYGIKLYLYINEPRSMPESFYEQYPHLKGHTAKENKICLCTSTPEVQNYLREGIASLCEAVPGLGGFFTITRSENPTNCYSHSFPLVSDDRACTCPRCSQRSMGEVIGEVIGCIAEGAKRVDRNIKVIAWSWAWKEYNEEIIRHLPKGVILMSQSELAVPFEIGGVQGQVSDYSMGVIGPGERAVNEWRLAKECGLETAAKVQVGTTWEGSTVPALPVYPLVDEHIRRITDQGVEHVLLGWTLGGYPSKNMQVAAKYFYDNCKLPQESATVQKAAQCFADAFKEFPFHIKTLYHGPQNAGPSTMLYLEPTGFESTMTCFAYDDLEQWRSIYPVDVFEDQFAKLCRKWQEGLELLKDEPYGETRLMAEAAYCLYQASLNQIRFIRARERGDLALMQTLAKDELRLAEWMLELMNRDASIGFEAANHYYFSKGQLLEKILNCNYIIEKTTLA